MTPDLKNALNQLPADLREEVLDLDLLANQGRQDHFFLLGFLEACALRPSNLPHGTTSHASKAWALNQVHRVVEAAVLARDIEPRDA